MLLVDRELVERVRGAQAGTELLGVVQSAVELEHATIPPYLTAYYTLRPGRNDEIATAVVFLLTDASQYVVGQTLNVDGGTILS